jgi:hypothetical protein
MTDSPGQPAVTPPPSANGAEGTEKPPAPPQEAHPAAPASTAPPPTASANAKIGQVAEGDVFVGETQTIYQTQYFGRQEKLRLSPSLHFERRERGFLERERERLFWSTEPHMLIDTLESHRFLVLSGDPELGKGTVARLLATEICSKHKLSELLFCQQSPPREMEVPLPDLFGGSREYHGRAVVLKDVLARSNSDIHGFLQGLNEVQIRVQSEKLEKCGSFVIFTTDSERLGGLEAKLQGFGLLKPLSPPDPDILLETLRRIAEPLLQSDAAKKALNELLKVSGKQIAEELRTVPRVARFIRESLADILSGRPDRPLEQALRRACDLESWLLRDLPEDFEAWCYALALVLCQAAPLNESVTWLHFDRFRQLLSRHLRQELRRFGEKREALDLCREEDLARLARAEIQRPGFPQASIVAFSSDSYPARLWQVLLGPGRHLLALLVPFLQALISAPEYYLRAIAARALGRIGELDPFGITVPWLQNPGEGDKERRSRCLGQMLQGVFGSNDEEYKRACFRQLRRKLLSQRDDDIVIALASLRDVGELNLSQALGEMRSTANSWLIPHSEDGKKPDQRNTLKWHVQELERLAETDLRAAALLKAAESGHIQGILDETFSEIGHSVLHGIQYALVGLCLSREPFASLVAELKAWLAEESTESGQFLTLAFLRPHGILHVLDHIPMPISEQAGAVSAGDTECGVILSDLVSAGDPAIPSFKAFVETLHSRLSALPGPLRQGLRKRWLGSLKGWAHQACRAKACRPLVVNLLQGLVRSPSSEVRRDVLSMLQGDSDFLRADSKMKAIAVGAITGFYEDA